MKSVVENNISGILRFHSFFSGCKWRRRLNVCAICCGCICAAKKSIIANPWIYPFPPPLHTLLHFLFFIRIFPSFFFFPFCSIPFHWIRNCSRGSFHPTTDGERGRGRKIDRRSCCYGQPGQLRRPTLLVCASLSPPPHLPQPPPDSSSPIGKASLFPPIAEISSFPAYVSVCSVRPEIVDSPHHHHRFGLFFSLSLLSTRSYLHERSGIPPPIPIFIND